MALITTVAGSTSDSYCTISEVTSNLLGTALNSWLELPSTKEREAYLKKVTRIIDIQNYREDRYDKSQSLKFPFVTHYTNNVTGESVPYIVSHVKYAVYSQISYLLISSLKGSLEYRAAGVKSLSLGAGTSMSFTDKDISSKDLLCIDARMILKRYFVSGGIRLRRA